MIRFLVLADVYQDIVVECADCHVSVDFGQFVSLSQLNEWARKHEEGIHG